MKRLAGNRRGLTTLLSVALSLAVIAAIYFSTDWAEMGRVLRNIHGAWYLAAFLISLLNYGLRTARFRMLLYSQRTPWLRMASITCLHGMLNYVMPAKSGELSYLYLLRRRLRVSLAESASTLVAARLYDFLTISLFLPFALAVFWGRMPAWMSYSAIALCLLVFAGWYGVLWLMRREIAPRPEEDGGWAARLYNRLLTFLAAGRTIYRRRQHARLWLLTLLIWLCVFSVAYCLAASLGYRLGFFQMVVIALFMIPLTLFPIQGFANLGAHEVGWVAAMSLFGYSTGVATTVAVGSHVLQLAIMLAIGLIGFLTSLFLTGDSGFALLANGAGERG